MTLQSLSHDYLASIESELQRIVSNLNQPHMLPFSEMLTYHMGWTGSGSGPETQGKRIRPLILLLACSASGGSWQAALPAASCVELIHNFSLVHDDIQDQSDLRRGRLTVWKKWGVAHAINAGDALFILAHISLLDLTDAFPADLVSQAYRILNLASLNLSSGQYLDMSYESRTDLPVEDYWPMISGKTAALLSACAEIGAVLGGAKEEKQDAFREFGQYLGLAFQVQDDYLGIWGDSALTGKSTESDLMTGKKSLPILYGLSKGGKFAHRWNENTPILADEVGTLADQLTAEGVKLYIQETADQMTDLALQSLRQADPQGEAGEALFELTDQLLNRQA